jgi:DnaJ like chaperone protein
MVWSSIAVAAESGRLAGVRALFQRCAAMLRRLLPSRRTGVASPSFMSSFVSLAAKMAKADGVAVPAEAAAFEKFVDATCSGTVAMRRLYDLAKADTAGYELYAQRIATLLRHEPETRRAVFECLMYVACSDGVLHPKEDEFLHVVATAFEIPDAEFKAIRCKFVRDFDCPYEVLELPPGATLGEVKTRYRQLANRYHPDRLAGQGAPLAAQKAAAAKLAQINIAYSQIEKGLRAA